MLECLIISSDKAARDTVEVGLEETSAFTVTCVDGHLARKTVGSKHHDLVVVDEQLGPKDDGVAFVEEVKESVPRTHFLLMARETRRGMRKGPARLFDGTIRIPAEPDAFFALIARVIERMNAPSR